MIAACMDKKSFTSYGCTTYGLVALFFSNFIECINLSLKFSFLLTVLFFTLLISYSYA